MFQGAPAKEPNSQTPVTSANEHGPLPAAENAPAKRTPCRARWLVIFRVLTVTLAMTSCTSNQPPPQPPQTWEWRELSAEGLYPVAITQLTPDTVILQGSRYRPNTDVEIESDIAFDLATGKVLWERPAPCSQPGEIECYTDGDETGYVTQEYSDVTAVNPRTGAVIGQATLPDSVVPPPTAAPSAARPRAVNPSATPTPPHPKITPPPTWPSATWSFPSTLTPSTYRPGPSVHMVFAGQGVILMTDYHSVSVRTMEHPDVVVWSAPSAPAPTEHIFDRSYWLVGGQWVNTATGPRDLHTGEPAPFGRTVRFGPDAPNYFLGPAPNRIFAVTITQPPGDPLDLPLLTPWDTVNDKALGPVSVPGDTVDANANLDVFVAQVNYGVDERHPTTAYSWPSGNQLWQKPELTNSYGGAFAGHAYVTQSSLRGVYVLDANTGARLGSKVSFPIQCHGWDTVGNMLYVATDVLTAYDTSLDQFETYSFPSPGDTIYGLFATPRYVGIILGSSLWIHDV